MRVQFIVVCEKCNTRLQTSDGLLYTHLNPADCDGSEAHVAPCSVEALNSFLITLGAANNIAPEEAPAKKSTKSAKSTRKARK